MKHFVFCLELLLLTLFLSSTAKAQELDFITTQSGGVNYNIFYDGWGENAVAIYATVDRNEGFSGFANISESVSGVYEWRDPSGEWHAITLTATVIAIEPSAFANCTNLTGDNIPSSVIYMFASAFYGCSSLTSVSIPNSIDAIQDWTFCNCTSLTNFTVPDSIRYIGMGAFDGCSSLTSLSIGKSVERIGHRALFGCHNLKELVWNARDCCDVGEFIDTFDFPVLEKLTIGHDVEYLPDFTIDHIAATELIWNAHHCGYNSFVTGNLEKVTIGNEVEIIPGGFASYSSITDVTIPNSVKTIGSDAFQGCTELTEIIIPNSVTTIGSHAFEGCTGFTEINIPNSVNTIGSAAFANCTGLTEINIPNSVNTISNSLFYGCLGLKKVTIPESVSYIDDYAFSNCEALTDVQIPISVDTIGWRAFGYCTNLIKIYWNAQNCVYHGQLPSGKVFQSCTNVKHIVIGEKVESIDINNEGGWNNNTFGSLNPDTVTCYATIPPAIVENYFNKTTRENAILRVPKSSMNMYATATGWKEFYNIVSIATHGDIDGDDKVSIADVTTLIDMLLSGNTAGNEAADCDQDGIVSIADVTTLIDYLLSGSW